MVIHIESTYENGVLRPSEPLDLPNQTPVHVTVVSEEILPDAPQLTVDEFRKIMKEGTFRGGTLSVDFDRDDIYSDYD